MWTCSRFQKMPVLAPPSWRNRSWFLQHRRSCYNIQFFSSTLFWDVERLIQSSIEGANQKGKDPAAFIANHLLSNYMVFGNKSDVKPETLSDLPLSRIVLVPFYLNIKILSLCMAVRRGRDLRVKFRIFRFFVSDLVCYSHDFGRIEIGRGVFRITRMYAFLRLNPDFSGFLPGAFMSQKFTCCFVVCYCSRSRPLNHP